MAAAVRKTGNHDRWIQKACDTVASHAYRIDRTVISNQSHERLAVAVKSQARNATIEIFNWFHSNRRGTAICRHEHQMLHTVGAKFFLVAFEENDPLSLRRPFGPRATGAII